MATAPAVPMTLDSVTVGGPKLPPRILLYGTDGIGKSTFASQLDNPIFIPTEEGSSRIDVPQFPLCETFDDVIGCMRALFTSKHEYKTLVLDSADWTQAAVYRLVVARDFNGDTDKADAYGRVYVPMMNEWLKLLANLDTTRRKLGMTIVLIAHALVLKFQNPMGDDYDRYQPNLVHTPKTSLLNKTREWADLVLFATTDVKVNKAEPQAKKGKAVTVKGADGDRWLYSVGSAAYDAKVRAGWSLPGRMPLNAATFQQYVSGQVQPETNEQEDAE